MRKNSEVNTALCPVLLALCLAGNAFLTLWKWAITCIINLVKTSFLVTATLPLHLDMKGAPEKRKSREVLWVGLNLFCFYRVNKWPSSTAASGAVSGTPAFYNLLFVHSDTGQSLPPQLEYFYLEPLPVRDEPTPERLGFIVSLGVDCVYPQGSGKGSQVHQLFLVVFGRKGVASEPMTGGAQRLTRTYLKNYWTDSSF